MQRLQCCFRFSQWRGEKEGGRAPEGKGDGKCTGKVKKGRKARFQGGRKGKK